MAGSYSHVVDDQGRLSTGDQINDMLECMSGDVVECVEEMYGMIWYLAQALAEEHGRPAETKYFIEQAQENFRDGIYSSPGRVKEE